MGENFFSVIFYSLPILEGNYRELKKAIQRYLEPIATGEFLFDDEERIQTHINSSREIARLIHNYAAASFSLVDHTRAIKNKLKGHDEKELRDFAFEYEEKLNESVKNSFENLFVKDLRRYVQHKAVVVPSLQIKLTRVNFSNSSSEISQAEVKHSFELDSKQLQDFDWGRASKEYIVSHRTIPVEEIIDKHFASIKEFYLWIQFRDTQLHPYASNSVKQSTFEEWKQQQNRA